MAMRSTKDIRSIVEGVRTMNKSKINNQSATDSIAEETFITAAADDARQKKMQILQQFDKDTIETIQKKLFATRQELEDLKSKFATMKRNYDSVSQHAATSNSEFAKL
jgi:hypothetical protein